MIYRDVLKPKRNNPAFTIVELLVVIVVIGILAAITIVSYTGITSRAVVSALQSDLTNASSQLKLYQIDHSAYPTSLNASNCPLDSSGVVDSTYCIKPTSGNTFLYSSNNNSNPQTFSLYAINTSTDTKYRTTDSSSPTVATPVVATGGTITNIAGYKIHTFTASGTFTVTSGDNVEVLVVGGGGGGGRYGGGGGAGGYQYNLSSVVTSQTYSVVVGDGGNGWVGGAQSGGNAASGSLSSFNNIISAGGGGGGNYGNATGGSVGLAGGSGGGSGNRNVVEGTSPLSAEGNTPVVTPSQGNSGGSAGGSSYSSISGGGGGGAGGNGQPGSAGGGGGIGAANYISGIMSYYAGGGSGGQFNAKLTGGAGGGGYGQIAGVTTADVDGVANTGGGGGGARDGSIDGIVRAGNGGSGIVVIRYPN